MFVRATQEAAIQSSDTAAGTPILLSSLDPWMLVVLVLAALAALLLCLWMIYFYINRIRTDEIRRQMLYDAVHKGVYFKLRGQTPPEPPDVADDPQYINYLESRRAELVAELKHLQGQIAALSAIANLSPDDADKLRSLRDEAATREVPLATEFDETRIKDLRARHEERKSKVERYEKGLLDLASVEAKSLVPESLTIAGMGITGAFFIELTAILTIIFGVIILGLVGVLGTQEIAPILAGIAGYVLGKTTSGVAQAPAMPRVPSGAAAASAGAPTDGS